MAKEDLIRNNTFRKTVMTQAEIQQALIDNFISLQKVMTNLSVKFEELSTNMSKLLQLFEISAKTFAEKYSTQELAQENAVDTELIKKLSILLDQNKLISRGIMLIEEKMRDRNNIFEQPQPQGQPLQQYPYPMMLPSMQPQQFSQQPPAPSFYKKEIGERQNSKPLPKN